MEAVDETELNEIRSQLQRQKTYGTNLFRKAIKSAIGKTCRARKDWAAAKG